MKKLTPASAIILASIAAACGGGPGADLNVRVVGQLSYPDPNGCGGPVYSQSVSWADCHKFKHQFDPVSGEEFTSGNYEPTALRPLAGTITISYQEKKADGTTSECTHVTAQSDELGTFNIPLQGCGVGKPVRVVGKVSLAFEIDQKAGDRKGTVRAVWPKSLATQVFPNMGGELDEQDAFTDTDGTVYAIPELGFTYDLDAEPAPAGGSGQSIVNVGNQVFLTDAAEDPFDYLHQVVSAWGTMLELHSRVREKFFDADQYYDSMFIAGRGSNWGQSFTIYFNTGWAFGGHGGISLYKPDYARFSADSNGDGKPDGADPIGWLLSSTSTLSHEFGHTVHGGFAGHSFIIDYAFANPLRRKDNTDYDWGHAGGQYQELGTAYTEGFASTIGQYLLNSCEGFVWWARPLGGANPFSTNMWNTDPSCDDSDGCGYHHTRYHLAHRGIVEGSAEWNKRVAALQALTALGTSIGHQFVTSNSESRISEWGCDLLDRDSDVSYAAGKVGGKQYVSDFTLQVAEALDGAQVSMAIGQFDADPVSEDVTISLPQLLEAMGSFCTGCGSMVGGSQWGHAYNVQRISAATGMLSAQSLSRYLVSRGWMTEAQGQNLLKANFMEAF